MRATVWGALVLLTVLTGCAKLDGVEQTLHEHFPAAAAVRRARPRQPTDQHTGVFAVEGADGLLGYAVRMRVVSRSGPFPILIVTGSDLRVRQVQVLAYMGERGSAVRQPLFTDQFTGKGPGDPIRLGEDTDAVTGATISSRVMTDAVRRALRLLQREFGTHQGAAARSR
jgi:hypothetical protein